ncbi:hypothetical protein [Rhizobium sp. LEGMi135b]
MFVTIGKKVSSYFRFAMFGLAVFTFSHAANAEGFDLALIRSPLKLSAVPRFDNGKNIGMSATLTRDALEYKAIKGKFLLSPHGKFDLQKLLSRSQPSYKDADGAFIYSIENWQEIADLNKDYIYIKAGQIPRYVYAYKSKYIPTGQPGIFICLVWNPDFENFYETSLGHMRCDVFRNK